MGFPAGYRPENTHQAPGSGLAATPQQPFTWVNKTASSAVDRSEVRANSQEPATTRLDHRPMAQGTSTSTREESNSSTAQPQGDHTAACDADVGTGAQASKGVNVGTAAGGGDDGGDGGAEAEGGAESDNNTGGADDRRYGWLQDNVIPTSTWADRHPGKKTQPVRSSRPQNAAERKAKKMRSQTIQDNMRKLQNDIVAVQEFCRMRAREIAKKHGKKVPYVERLIASSSVFRPARRVNLRNAIIHRKARELNHGTSFSYLWLR
jgi:hypothetical protein